MLLPGWHQHADFNALVEELTSHSTVKVVKRNHQLLGFSDPSGADRRKERGDELS